MMLEQLSKAVGMSGKEEAVRKIVLEAIKDHAENIRIDAMGGVTAIRPAKKNKKNAEQPLRVMLAAHMDEVGLMVMGFDGDGLIRFTAIGGIDDRILPGKRVKIGDVNGVIIWVPIHKNQEQNVVKIANLRIDIGASSKDEAAGKVKRGDHIAFESTYMELDGGRMLRGKAFDDRAGVSMLIDVLQAKNGYPVDVQAAFTVQEEIGLRGAIIAANRLQPDVCFVLEGTTAHDLPNPTAQADDERDLNPTSRMGGGPVLTIMDNGMIADPRLRKFLAETAEAEGIPYQYKTMGAGGTDGGSIHKTLAGVPTAVLALPCRYIHSPAAYLLREDYDNQLRLVQAALRRITPAVLGR
ncbi:MAG: M42 family metallopeptidase [Pleurocapsa minor GSE-CHR-MK-17-07R]|jgi:endoglucanase|nr:M42 family metallopeptidase [Pleurocapsa minor GSE-CHR-MK 17-07R]